MKWASLLRKTQQCERYCTNYIIWGKFSIKFVRKIELDSTDVLVRVSKEGSWRQNTLETFSHFSNVDFKILNLAQWLWLSWQSGRFRHQRSAVQIPSSAKFVLNTVYLIVFLYSKCWSISHSICVFLYLSLFLPLVTCLSFLFQVLYLTVSLSLPWLSLRLFICLSYPACFLFNFGHIKLNFGLH